MNDLQSQDPCPCSMSIWFPAQAQKPEANTPHSSTGPRLCPFPPLHAALSLQVYTEENLVTASSAREQHLQCGLRLLRGSLGYGVQGLQFKVFSLPWGTVGIALLPVLRGFRFMRLCMSTSRGLCSSAKKSSTCKSNAIREPPHEKSSNMQKKG